MPTKTETDTCGATKGGVVCDKPLEHADYHEGAEGKMRTRWGNEKHFAPGPGRARLPVTRDAGAADFAGRTKE